MLASAMELDRSAMLSKGNALLSPEMNCKGLKKWGAEKQWYRVGLRRKAMEPQRFEMICKGDAKL